MSLPTNAKERKELPIASGVLDYFPDALAEVARVSKVGNDQHNPGQPLHWDRSKSFDEADAAIRHFIERDSKDTDGTYHAAKAAWRMLAFLQKKIEEDRQLETITAGLPGPPPSSIAYSYAPIEVPCHFGLQGDSYTVVSRPTFTDYETSGDVVRPDVQGTQDSIGRTLQSGRNDWGKPVITTGFNSTPNLSKNRT